jgi:hypothetical protein
MRVKSSSAALLVLLAALPCLITACQPSQPVYPPHLYLLKVNATDGSSQILGETFPDTSTCPSNCAPTGSWVVKASGNYTYVANSPEADSGIDTIAYVEGGDVFRSNGNRLGPCPTDLRFTTSGLATMVSLSGSGLCTDRIAYIENHNAYVGQAGDPSSVQNIGAAEAVHLSPDGTKVLLFQAPVEQPQVLNYCNVDGTSCSAVNLPEGSDLSTATITADGQHVVFDYLSGGHMQVATANLDGTNPQTLTNLTDSDAMLPEVYDSNFAETLNYGNNDYRIVTLDASRMTTVNSGGWYTFAVFPSQLGTVIQDLDAAAHGRIKPEPQRESPAS